MTHSTLERADFLTPHGNRIRFAVRPGTSDWNTCNAITAVGDEYHQPKGLSGWALDVGAHIGACAVTLLVDNPELRVVAIEALPENVEMIRENLRLNGVEDRCIVIEGAAGDGESCRIGYGDVGDPTLIHEFIGNMTAPPGSREVVAKGVSLDDVLDAVYDHETPTNGAQVVWAKIDCEGCEYPFFDSPSVIRIDRIEGEYHPNTGGQARLRELLEPTHDLTITPHTGATDDFGAFTAVRRMERGVRYYPVTGKTEYVERPTDPDRPDFYVDGKPVPK